MAEPGAAVSATVEAETRPQLAAASGHLADAIKTVGVDNWPRFVADARRRAHFKATLAAIEKSRQPVISVSARVGGAGSGNAGGGASPPYSALSADSDGNRQGAAARRASLSLVQNERWQALGVGWDVAVSGAKAPRVTAPLAGSRVPVR